MIKEQEYWSLNGSFGMLQLLQEKVTEGEIDSLDSLNIFLLDGLQFIHSEMTKMEEEMEKDENSTT